MKKTIAVVLTSMLLLFTAACGKEPHPVQTEKEHNKGKLSVYTTVYPLTYFTERIGGDYVSVKSIYPAGSNEHTFEPTQRNMMELADADLFFYIGLGLEGFVDKAKRTLHGEQVKMVATAEGLSEDEIQAGHTEEEDEHGEEGHEDHQHGAIDPHVWISPILSQKLSLAIKNALIEQDPEHEAVYAENYENLIAELKQLDQEFKAMADQAENKTFFVSHAAFGYLAKPYGLEQVAIAGLNSQDEPSQKKLTEIVQLAKEKNIHYILFEQNVSSKTANVIRKEIGAESLVMHNLGVLTDKDITNKETYFTLMRHNLKTLKKALNSK